SQRGQARYGTTPAPTQTPTSGDIWAQIDAELKRLATPNAGPLWEKAVDRAEKENSLVDPEVTSCQFTGFSPRGRIESGDKYVEFTATCTCGVRSRRTWGQAQVGIVYTGLAQKGGDGRWAIALDPDPH